MPLHRLTIPTYFGGLPGTHDYINDPAANGDPGSPAPADGKKAAAPAPGNLNEGTYFIAFSEPAQALTVNRPARAVAENTDFLDDVIHRDLAIPAFFDVGAGHGGTSSLVLTGDVFVGAAGTPNNQGIRDQLIQVVDPVTNIPIVLQIAAGPPPTYAPVATALVHDGSSNNQVGNGFYINPTVNFAVSIPNATAFRVLFHVRGRLKDQPSGVLTRVRAEPIGLGSALASIQAIQGDAAFRNASNSFAAAFTQSFLGPVVAGQTIAFTKPSLTPALTNVDLASSRVLIGEFLVEAVPAVYLRLYKVSGTDRGLEVTINARWAQSSSPEWAADSTAREPTRFRVIGGATASFLSQVAVQALPVGQATWPEARWTTASGGVIPTSILELAQGIFTSKEYQNNKPAFRTTRLITDDTTDAAGNHYKLILEFATSSTGGKVRLYVSDNFASAGSLFLTYNAVWNTGTLLWSADNISNDSQALVLYNVATGGSSGFSALSGSGLSDGKGHRSGGLVYLTKATINSPNTWAADGWDKIPPGLGSIASSGHFRIPGEYGYTSAAGGKSMRLRPNVMHWIGTGGWAFSDALLGSGGSNTGLRWTCSTPSSDLYIPLEIPVYSIINRVSLEVDPLNPSGGDDRLFFDVFEQDIDTRNTVNLNGDDTDGTSSIQTIDISSGLFPRVAAPGKMYFIRLRHSESAGDEFVHWAQVEYTAPINVPGIGEPFGAGSPYTP